MNTAGRIVRNTDNIPDVWKKCARRKKEGRENISPRGNQTAKLMRAWQSRPNIQSAQFYHINSPIFYVKHGKPKFTVKFYFFLLTFATKLVPQSIN